MVDPLGQEGRDRHPAGPHIGREVGQDQQRSGGRQRPAQDGPAGTGQPPRHDHCDQQEGVDHQAPRLGAAEQRQYGGEPPGQDVRAEHRQRVADAEHQGDEQPGDEQPRTAAPALGEREHHQQGDQRNAQVPGVAVAAPARPIPQQGELPGDQVAQEVAPALGAMADGREQDRLVRARPGGQRVEQGNAEHGRHRVGAGHRAGRRPEPLPPDRAGRQPDQREQPAHEGQRGERFGADVELGAQHHAEQRDDQARGQGAVQQPHDQVGGERDQEDQRQVGMAHPELVDQVGREAEEEATGERGQERPGQMPAQQVGGPRGQRRGGELNQVEGEEGPGDRGDRRQGDGGEWHRGDPGQVDPRGRPRSGRVQRVDSVRDRVRPPAEHPDEDRAVLGARREEPGGHPAQDPRTEHGQAQAAVGQQGQQVLAAAAARHRPASGGLARRAGATASRALRRGCPRWRRGLVGRCPASRRVLRCPAARWRPAGRLHPFGHGCLPLPG